MKEKGQCEIFCGEDQTGYEGLDQIGKHLIHSIEYFPVKKSIFI